MKRESDIAQKITNLVKEEIDLFTVDVILHGNEARVDSCELCKRKQAENMRF